MNLFKGILRRSSATASSDRSSSSSSSSNSSSSNSQSWQDIQFSKDAPEATLDNSWEEYQCAESKEERQKALEGFIFKFNLVFERWVPKENHSLDDVVFGCSFGHPTRVVAGLVQELKRTNDFIAELHASSGDPLLITGDMEVALGLLSALTITSRAPHNRSIFSFFGGLHLLTSLMKNAVVHVKSIANAAPDTTPGSSALLLLSFLQCLLAHVVSITASFMNSDKPSTEADKDNVEPDAPKGRQRRQSSASKDVTSSTTLLETGGLNWFVELLRVLRKLRLRGIATDESLETLTLQTLKTAIASNTRVQNHFKSIGGLEVLLDGLGGLIGTSDDLLDRERSATSRLEHYKLQILSLEAIREAVFRNVSCIQCLRELNGVHKFIDVLRWTAISLPGYLADATAESTEASGSIKLPASSPIIQKDDQEKSWDAYVWQLCQTVCSFLVASGGIPQEPSGLYWESASRFVVNVLLGVFQDEDHLLQSRLLSSSMQRNVLGIFNTMLGISPPVLQLFREEGVWNVLFSSYFFYFDMEKKNDDTEPLQLEVISFVEMAATVNGHANNLLECSTLIQALEQCTRLPKVITMILKSLHRILQLAPESTSSSFKQLDAVVVLSEVMAVQLQELKKGDHEEELLQARDATFSLFNEYLVSCEDAKFVVLRTVKLMDVLFNLLCDSQSKAFAIHHIRSFMKLVPNSEADQDAKMELCMKYLEHLSRIQSDCHSDVVTIICDLLEILRDVLLNDVTYYQTLFREVECFVHIVSLLNETYPDDVGKKLCLEVIATLTCLLKGNEASKLAFRSLVGPGYRMLETLLIDRYKGHPNQELLDAVLSMLGDGTSRLIIQNEDAVILLCNIIRQCDNNTRLRALDSFLKLLEDSSSNQASCVKSGLLCLLLDWFESEAGTEIAAKLAQLMQVVGGHSMSGKEMRKIFLLLRTTMDNSKAKNALLLNNLKAMLKERGPSVFFENSGTDSGIVITTPLRWPTNKGFSFLCWIRVEAVRPDTLMGLFSFLSETGKGCAAQLSTNKLIVQSLGQKRQAISTNISLVFKRWHCICITHSTSRALSSGSFLKVYIDGVLVSNEKLRYAKVYDPMTCCSIGASTPYPILEENDEQLLLEGYSAPFCGQLGPIFLFDDLLTQDQVQGVYTLGARSMFSDTLFSPKEGISSKMILGCNAQASVGRNLINIATEGQHEATIMAGTQLCYRRLVQDNIHCVGGVGVFFPLLTHLEQPLNYTVEDIVSRHRDNSYVVDVLELLTAFLDGNLANQKLLDNSGGLSLLGFLLQFVSFRQLSVKVISSLNGLLGIFAEASDSSLAETLVKETIIKIYLNSAAWIYTPYVVQRELYLSLINFLENHQTYAKVCEFSQFLDIVHQFYWDKSRNRKTVKTSLAGERPRQNELSQLRLLVLALAEGAIRHSMSLSETKSLLSYIDRCDDLGCLEDVLQMLLGLLNDTEFCLNFSEHLQTLCALHVFLNLLRRQQEAIRILALQIVGALLVSNNNSGKKGNKLFSGSKGVSDQNDGKYRDAFVWSCIAERVALFEFSDTLRIALFDLLLGGFLPKKILQGSLLTQFGKPADKRSWLLQLRTAASFSRSNTVPQITIPRAVQLIMKCIVSIEDAPFRLSILKELVMTLDASPSNCEIVLQEQAWQDWLFPLLEKVYACKYQEGDQVTEEVVLTRKLLCALHSHAVCSLRGGWRHLERTASYTYIYAEKGSFCSETLMYDLLADLFEDVLKGRPPQEALSMQPCRDNVLFALSLVDEIVLRDAFQFLPFSDRSAVEESQDSTLLSGSYVDLEFEAAGERKHRRFVHRLYDHVWSLVSAVNGKGQDGTTYAHSGSSATLGQRARGLVESLNLPAAEMAAAVTGGLGSVGFNVPVRSVEKALKLRTEKFLRLAFRLILLYLHKADLEQVMASVRQFLVLLPALLVVDSEQNRSQLHLLLWSLLDAREHVGAMDDGARYHVLSQLIQEVLAIGKNSLASSLVDRDRRLAEAGSNEFSSVYDLLQQEKVFSSVKEDRKCLNSSQQQWTVEIETLRAELKESQLAVLQETALLEEQTLTIGNALYQSEKVRRMARGLKHDEDEQAVANRWSLTLRNMTDERGPWSSLQFPNNNLMNWKLDKTEDPLRRRMKLKRNYHFDQTLVLPPASSSKSLASETKNNVSSDGGGYPRKLSSSFKALFDKEAENIEDDNEMQDAKDEFVKEAELDNPSLESIDAAEVKAAEDEVLLSVCCVLVSTKRKLAGRLEVTQASLHFHLNRVLEGTAGSMVFDASGAFRQDESSGADGEKLKQTKQHRKWEISQITAIHATRYLLQHTALEIFLANAAAPVFLNFHSQQTAKDTALKIIASRAKDRSQIHYVDRKKALELAERARDCWRRRECSNFEYLMILNTLAGRSHNDLTQYPVVPWILSDYSSDTLDLNNTSVYRDLSKPVGALDEKRFQVFQERYINFSDPDIPSFLYGSHYSSMGIVLFYLLRLEPFTCLHRILQGGKFDHADRLFHSIHAAYSNCLTNTSDVKELTPEFFYMPEFLLNMNKYFIGERQDGQHIDDVVLPPWAKGSAEEFIRLHREALESEYVSEHLHHWIDLTFGYKQRGRPAVDAANVFYYLTYEGAVELESMTDLQQRASVEDQIANFGQTPIQLFRKKHPKRGFAAPILRPLYYSPSSITLTSSISSRHLSSGLTEQDFPVVFLAHCDGKVVSLTSEVAASVRLWLTPLIQGGGSFTFSSSQDFFFGLGQEVWPPHKISGYYADALEVNATCFATLQANSSIYLLTCGHWDNSFKVVCLNDGHLTKTICQHKDVVTCVSVSVDGSVLATGSRDTTIMVWDVLSYSGKKRSREAHKNNASNNDLVSDKPRHVLCGHDDVVTCVVVRSELDLVVSASRDGTCIFHTLRQGRYVRSLVQPNRNPISLLAVSQHGTIVIFSNDDLNMHAYSVNGKLLGQAEHNGRLSTMQLSTCGDYIVCGGDQGQVCVRKVHSLELVQKYECSSSSNSSSGTGILSLCVTPEDCFLVGTRDGKVFIFSVDSSPRRRAVVQALT